MKRARGTDRYAPGYHMRPITYLFSMRICVNMFAECSYSLKWLLFREAPRGTCISNGGVLEYGAVERVRVIDHEKARDHISLLHRHLNALAAQKSTGLL